MCYSLYLFQYDMYDNAQVLQPVLVTTQPNIAQDCIYWDINYRAEHILQYCIPYSSIFRVLWERWNPWRGHGASIVRTVAKIKSAGGLWTV